MTRIEELEREVAALRLRLEHQGADARSGPDPDLLQRVFGDRVVLENLPDLVCLLERDQTILYLNRTLPGHDMETVIGRSALEYLPEEYRERYCASFELAWRSRQPQTVEFAGRSGTSWKARLVPIQEHDVVKLMLAASSDTSAHVRTERALYESDSRLRLATEVVGMGTWTHDMRNGAVVWDEALCVIFGVPQLETPRRFEDFISMVHPEDRGRVQAAIDQIRSTEHFDDLEHRIVLPSGEVRYVRGTGSALRDTEGVLCGWLGAVFDVTDRKRLEEQLQQRQKMEAVGELTAGIAHNFNNVLGIILPNVEMCKEDSTPQVNERLEDIEHATLRAADMIRQLMLFARRDAAVAKSAVDLSELVRRTIDICRATFDRGIRLDLELAPGIPRVLANESQLEQVLLNICINARDALESSRTSSPRIAISVDRGNAGTVRLRVADNGPGMDEKTRARVFEPFFTTKEVGRGTGLGLATVYAIIRDLGGQVTCSSRVGRGAMFEIELEAIAMHPAASPQLKPTVAMLGGTETILLVDDDPLVRRATRGLLERSGYRVMESSEGAEALRLFERSRPQIDLVVLDRSMPGLSGEEVLAHLEQLAPDVPVLFLSGHASLPEDAPSTAMTLTKPVDRESLLRTIRSILDGANVAGIRHASSVTTH